MSNDKIAVIEAVQSIINNPEKTENDIQRFLEQNT
ncbi:hypothetical protein J2Z58_003818 [Halobacillus andaensis]|nr:hypothetical protein [Halobacillus andaensis]